MDSPFASWLTLVTQLVCVRRPCVEQSIPRPIRSLDPGTGTDPELTQSHLGHSRPAILVDEAATAHFHQYSSTSSSHDAHSTDTHLETKESRPFRLDRHRSFRNLDWRQRRYEQHYHEQLCNPPNPVKDMKGTRGEVWHVGRVKQRLAVRPVWLRTCHCTDCVRFRFIEKDKERRAEVACAIKRVDRSGGSHLRHENAWDCWDSSCTGCLWDMPPVREDGNQAGESHSEGYDRQRTIPFEVDILDLLILPHRSRRRARAISGLIPGKGTPRRAVFSDTKSEGWVFVHEDMLLEDSSEWDHCSVASL